MTEVPEFGKKLLAMPSEEKVVQVQDKKQEETDEVDEKAEVEIDAEYAAYD